MCSSDLPTLPSSRNCSRLLKLKAERYRCRSFLRTCWPCCPSRYNRTRRHMPRTHTHTQTQRHLPSEIARVCRLALPPWCEQLSPLEPAGAQNGAGDGELFFFGIVDYLQKYNTTKRLAHFTKSVRGDSVRRRCRTQHHHHASCLTHCLLALIRTHLTRNAFQPSIPPRTRNASARRSHRTLPDTNNETLDDDRVHHSHLDYHHHHQHHHHQHHHHHHSCGTECVCVCMCV